MQYKDFEHHFPQRILSHQQTKNSVLFCCEDNLGKPLDFSVDFYQENTLRVRLWTKTFEAPYCPVADETKLTACLTRVQDDGDTLEVIFGTTTLRAGKDPFTLALYNAEGDALCAQNMKDVDSVGTGFQRVPPIGYSIALDGTVAGMNFSMNLQYDEHIYGLGQRFTPFDKVGQTVAIRNFDTLGCRDDTSYINIPFYLSSHGYGVLLHTHEVFSFHIGTESVNSLSAHVPGESLEFFIFTGETLKQTLAQYIHLTGPATLPPDWSFGLWHSTGFKGSNRISVEEDADTFRKKNIPCSVMHFDCYWMRDDMWCDFVWDDALYPNRVEMLARLKEQEYKVCLWINPYVTIVTEMYKEGKKLGYFVKDKNGDPYQADLWHGLLPLCVIVDFTNPDATKWYQNKLAGVLAEGVDTLKTDFGEDIPADAVFANGQSGLQMRNLYSRLYNKAVFEEIGRQKGKNNALVWARSGCTGMQQFPVCWSGDPYSSFEGMAATLRGGLSLAVSGVLFWSHDMGGFYGDITPEVYIRWCQFGLFTSHSRLHGVSTRQPWAYGKRAESIVTHYIRLRERLMPYILRTARECVQNGTPFIRPLVLEHPDDPTVYSIYDEYYFGDSLLVAPVFGGENAKRMVYLPEGSWKALWNEKIYESGWHKLVCQLEVMPVFQKVGSVLECI